MALVQMNIKDSDVNTLKDSDILIYCEARKYFYKTTAQSFFAEYERKYNNLINKYDEQIKLLLKENESLRLENEKFKNNLTLENENFKSNLRLENEKFKEEINNKMNSHIEKNKIINERLIDMVENFLKTGGKI